MRWFVKIRRYFGLFNIPEVIHVVQSVGHCKDREEFEWKVKVALTNLVKP